MNYLILFIIAIIWFAIFQVAVINIGNRSYSKYYESHLLFKRKGILKLIYFKPKHFHRYALDEIIFFFSSFLILLTAAVLSVVAYNGVIKDTTAVLIIVIIGLILLLLELGKVLVIDIQVGKEEKFYITQRNDEEIKKKLELFESQIAGYTPMEIKRNKAYLKSVRYSIIYGNNTAKLFNSYKILLSKINKGDLEKIDELDKQYINYYKNYQNVKVIKENKDGSFLFEIITDK